MPFADLLSEEERLAEIDPYKTKNPTVPETVDGDAVDIILHLADDNGNLRQKLQEAEARADTFFKFICLLQDYILLYRPSAGRYPH